MDKARETLGLDKPFFTQYFVWLGNLLKGDMGTSYVSNKDVFDTFLSKLPATLLLTVVSILLTVLISIPLGILSAVRQNKFTDYLYTFLQLCREQYAEFLCISGINVCTCNQAWLVSGNCH